MRGMKVLYVLRHAKSSWDDPAVADHERPLAPRGKKAAERMAAHFRQHQIIPTLVLCSDARRARQTLKPIEDFLAGRSELRFEDDLYAATAEQLLRHVRSLPEVVPSVMLVGHNPGLQDLVLLVARRGAKEQAAAAKFPTGALARLELDLERWNQVGQDTGELTELVLPREL